MGGKICLSGYCLCSAIGLWDGQLSLSPVAPVLLQCSVVVLAICCLHICCCLLYRVLFDVGLWVRNNMWYSTTAVPVELFIIIISYSLKNSHINLFLFRV